ncbi:MAG: hypothetical protein WD355_12305 [Balneolaceae bacterium]
MNPSFNIIKSEPWIMKAMILLLVIAWLPVLSNGFLLNWDDQWMVLQNPYLQETSLEAASAIFTDSYGGQYSPVNSLAYLALLETAGENAFWFHLFSLLLHIINFVLVGLVLKKLLGLIPNLSLSGNQILLISWATAFLFAVHPLQVESVAWISASKIVLFSFFYLLGMWFYLLYKETGNRLHLLWVMLCFLASLLSKEQAVVFVGTLVAVDLAITPAANLKQSAVWLEKIPFVALALLFSWFTLSIQAGSGAGGSYPFGHRILFANYSFWEYLVKLSVPHSLSHFYFFPMDPGEAIPNRFWFYPIATLFVLWLLYEYRERINRIYLFGGLFFLINLALVLHILPVPRGAIIADRYVYLSVIGFFLILVYGGVMLYGSLREKQRGAAFQRVLLAGAGVYLLFLMGTTHQRTYDWQDSETLYWDVEAVVEQHTGNYGLSMLNNAPITPCYDN